MGLSCLLGHKWEGCICTTCGAIRDQDHDWSKNCEKCVKCNTTRSDQHDWAKNCEQCSTCGATRLNQHNWSSNCEHCSKCETTRSNQHEWSKNCEQCSICKATRTDQHDFTKDCEKCERCGSICKSQHQWSGCQCTKCKKKKSFREQGHQWVGCKCSVCGTVGELGHDWDWCVCKICGKKKSFREEGHSWVGCKCSRCGTVGEMGHDWVRCECRRCGKKHNWVNGKCASCGKRVDPALVEKLYRAIKSRDDATIDSLLPQMDLYGNDKDGIPILIRAALNDDCATIKWLMAHGVDPKMRVDGGTALHIAANRGSGNVVSFLLSQKVDLNAVEGFKLLTPLLLAAAGNQTRIVEQLIEAGADKMSRDRSGMGAIHYAASNGHLRVVMILIEAGIDPNQIGEREFNARPIHYAALKGHADIVEYLVKKGAKVDYRDAGGNTPQDIAEAKGHHNVVAVLKEQNVALKSETPVQTSNTKQTSEKSKQMGIDAYRNGNIDLAIEWFERAIESDANNGDAWGLLGSLYIKQKNKRSIVCFENFIRILPKSPDGYQQLTIAYSKTDQFAQAKEAARKFTKVHPKNADSWAMLASLILENSTKATESSDIKEAIQYFEKANRIDPSNELAKGMLSKLKALNL